MCSNLSCARMEERQAMRVCPGLINSLMSYVQSCIAEDNPDDKVLNWTEMQGMPLSVN